MAQYVDYAEYYDLDHRTEIDIPFYLDYAQQCGGPILELACGTGRVLVPLAEAGLEMYGIDLSPNMLALCKDKVAARGLDDRVHLVLADMASFALPRRDFALVFVAVRSFMHLFTQEAQLACLVRVRDHLRPGGLFIADLYAPDCRLLDQQPDGEIVLRREFDLPNGHHAKRWDRFVRNDRVLQIQHYEIRFVEYDEDGVQVRERTLPMDTRYTFRWELELLLRYAGLKVVDVFRDYDRNAFDGTGEIIVVAQKPTEPMD